MRTRTRAGWAVLWLLLLAACRHEAVTRRAEGRFGTVALYAPRAPTAMVFLFSDADGWNATLDADARRLADSGAAAIGVDLPQYLHGLAASDDGCHYLISEVEDLSKRVQRELGFTGYASPVLAGIGAGGTLAYAALAQSPAATVAGAVSVDPAPSLATRVPLCPGAPSRREAGGGYRYGAAAALPGYWVLSASGDVPARLRAVATVVPGEGSATDRLFALLQERLSTGAAAHGAGLADLPLVELPAAQPGAAMAVIYSGDGGWRDIDKQIGEVLARRGVPVVGVDCLRYFWHRRTPDEIARDLGRIIGHYSDAWHTPQVALIGYSFGADVLPLAYNRLPETLRSRVVLVSLLGVEPRAALQFSVSGWFGAAPSDDAPLVLPEIQRFPPGLLQCVYGVEEPDTLCRDAALPAAEIIRTTGGHHFDGDYRALAQHVLDALRNRNPQMNTGQH